MKSRSFCPRCGADICLDEPIRIDDFSMIGDGYPLVWRGHLIQLTRGERIVVWSRLNAYPDHVSKPVLLDRLDSEGMNNTISVMISRIRGRLRAVGAPDAIETIWGKGHRWKPGGGDAVAATLAEGDTPIAELLNHLYDIPGVSRATDSESG